MSPPWNRIIAHADMDAFYAAVEQLDNPRLRGKPILIGPPSRRGVVLTASYEARPYGVGSAMPMVQALRQCPDALVVPPRFDRYQQVSATIMRVFGDFSPHVQAISLDEAFIDLSGSVLIFGPPIRMAEQIKKAVKEATGGLTVSVGVAASKYVAKVASAHQKPDGLTLVPEGTAREWLAPLPVGRLWGVGPKTEARMHALGYTTIGQIGNASIDQLQNELGSLGRRFHRLANAEDPRRVERRYKQRSMGSQRALSVDAADHDEIVSHLRRSAHRIARRLRAKGWRARGVRVRLRTSTFRSLTRQCTLAEPTDVADTLLAAGVRLLSRFDDPGPYRLVGMATFDFSSAKTPQQLSLLDVQPHRRKLEVTLDTLSQRYGSGAVVRANDLTRNTVFEGTPNLDFVDDIADRADAEKAVEDNLDLE